MSILLVQSCSKSKNRPGEPVNALELYSGYFFKIIKKAIRDDELQDEIDICVLSAEHGLIDTTDEISYYDRHMNPDRAAEIRDDITTELRGRVAENDYEHVIFNLGSAYRSAIGDLSDLPASVQFIEGDGIGYKGHTLKQIIRGNYSSLEMEVRNATAQAN
ncbi:DUF6884 domain-containing protein [Natrinema marinum]|uniref:DUF6884 domain-containing protein n=1 Tax=Natrinema marinum TaxID=2961598 RepID=UPI0020C8A760|nr:DUF6884 domain-containing protein [Natrinema marinum]